MKIKLVGTTFAVRKNPELKATAPSGEVEFIRNTGFDKPEDGPEQRGVMAVCGEIHIGWLGKGTTEQAEANTMLDDGREVSGTVVDSDYNGSKPYCNIETDWIATPVAGGKSCEQTNELPMNVELLTSFNENGVKIIFDEEAHTYSYGGQFFKSVTRLTGEGYPGFEKEAIAKKCSTPWGMPAADIVQMWENNGSAASMFGSAMHLFMENYDKFGERSLPKMPFLKDIVLAFPHNPKNIVHTEVLISAIDLGLCGLCDRFVDVGNQVYRVEDYKFNYGALEPSKSMVNKMFPDLPNCKLGKYVIQMSIYADMAERSGMKVHDDVVAHIWDGEWNNIAQPRIKNILDTILKG